MLEFGINCTWGPIAAYLLLAEKGPPCGDVWGTAPGLRLPVVPGWDGQSLVAPHPSRMGRAWYHQIKSRLWEYTLQSSGGETNPV